MSAILRRAFPHLLLMLGAVWMIMPFVWMLCTAFKAPSEIFEASLWPWPRTWFGAAHFVECHFLCSDASSGMTGQTLYVDAGCHAMA
jgi:ABC-type glycerol-3-phosphate transport system permease component